MLNHFHFSRKIQFNTGETLKYLAPLHTIRQTHRQASHKSCGEEAGSSHVFVERVQILSTEQKSIFVLSSGVVNSSLTLFVCLFNFLEIQVDSLGQPQGWQE